MCAAASFMLGLLHLMLWYKDRQAGVYLLSMLMAFSAGSGAMVELALLHAQSVESYRLLLQWENFLVFTLLVSMVWFVRARLPAASLWLAILITGLWSVAILVNWLSPYSLVYTEITALRQMPTFWGEYFALGTGPANPWVHLANLASVLIVVYVIHAAVKTWREGERRRAVLVGGSVAVFIALGGIHAPLVDAGLIATPYMVSFAFLAIVIALSYELISAAVLASRYAKEIRISEARWRSLLTHVQLAVIGIDPLGRIDYVNPFLEQLLGYHAESLVGKSVTALVPVTDQALLRERIKEAARTGPRPKSRWDLVCATGMHRSLDWSTVRLTAGDGSYAGVLSVGEDITERLATARNLERTRYEMWRIGRANMLGELVSALAHEINQPLAAILSNAQAARRFLAVENPDLDELREILDDIVRDDKRGGAVIRNLRRMLSKGEVERERFHIQESIRVVLGLMSCEFEVRGVSIREELDADLPPVGAGRVESQQVIMNLMSNAVRALSESSPERREIRIRAERHGEDAVMVSVEDQGPGIAPGELSQIFEPFVTTKPDGLGMGLAICRRIVEALGGRIWAENRISGTRVSFTLPLVEPEQTGD